MDQKDQSIQQVVLHLRSKFGDSNIILKDYWDGDNCAIGLYGPHGKRPAYISTWKKTKNHYFVSLEEEMPGEDVYPQSQEFDNVSLEELEKLVGAHLKLL